MPKVLKQPRPAPAPVSAPAKRGPGRPRAGTGEALPENVNELLAMLETATDQGDKRRIRARLRARGHRGGLGRRTAPAEKPKVSKVAKRPKPRAIAAAPAEDSEAVEE